MRQLSPHFLKVHIGRTPADGLAQAEVGARVGRYTAPVRSRSKVSAPLWYPHAVTLSRSQQMSRIGGKNTRPEVVLRSALWRAGHRYRLHARTQHGRPDVVFPRQRVAVFIDGCFWHGCPDHYVRPGARAEFWGGKLAANTTRDRAQTLALERDGWRLCRPWEHEIFTVLGDVTAAIHEALTASSWQPPMTWRVVRVDLLDPTTRLERRHLEELRVREPPRTEDRLRVTTKWQARP